MGGCEARPTESALKGHMIEKASKNDSYFSYTPFHAVSLEEIKSEDNLQSLETKIALFKKAKQDLISKLESSSCGLIMIPELNVEVQKAVNLDDSTLCIFEGEAYTKISLEPKGPKLVTKYSDKLFPSFGFFTQFKDVTKYSKLMFKVKEKRSILGDTLVGTYEIDLEKLKDQRIIDGWFELKSKNKTKPCICIRVQYFYNEQLLIEEMIKEIEEKIQVTQKVIDDIYYERYMSD